MSKHRIVKITKRHTAGFDVEHFEIQKKVLFGLFWYRVRLGPHHTPDWFFGSIGEFKSKENAEDYINEVLKSDNETNREVVGNY